MGNSVGRFDIVLDYETNQSIAGLTLAARAGNQVTGKIRIEVTKDIQDVSALKLQMHGKEKTFVYHGQKGKSHEYGDRRFVVALVTVASFDGQTLVPGFYEYPFTFSLHSSLPTSLQFRGRKDKADVVYKFTAFVEQRGNITKIQTKRRFLVAASPLPDSQVPCFLEPVTREIKAAGSIKKGTVTFGVSINDTHVGRGQGVSLSIASRNNSTASVKILKVELVENVQYGARNSSSRSQKIVLFGKDITGLPSFKKKTWPEVKEGQGQSQRQTRLQEIYDELASGLNTLDITIPRNARDTYAGNLIQISHYILITHMTKTLVDNPSIKIPIRIGYPPETSTNTENNREPSFRIAEENDSLRDIPVADALPISAEDWSAVAPVQAPLVEIPAENVILGGIATVAENGNERNSSAQWEGIIPLPPPVAPTLANLLEEMVASVDDYDIISQKVDDPSWRPVFSDLTPEEFGMIIAHVHVDFDQPKVAACIALLVGGVGGFTSKYAVAALKNTARWNRTTMVQKVLPLCTDLQTGQLEIMAELTEWEQTVTSHDFQEALR
mmetsp:Transcript_20592/g.31726  ORF Transcript_20592/g.31726 Transcript_20592/m.31726 type:complete len:555 (+) Transcript_20592:100-1764(+)